MGLVDLVRRGTMTLTRLRAATRMSALRTTRPGPECVPGDRPTLGRQLPHRVRTLEQALGEYLAGLVAVDGLPAISVPGSGEARGQQYGHSVFVRDREVGPGVGIQIR